jgi:integrase
MLRATHTSARTGVRTKSTIDATTTRTGTRAALTTVAVRSATGVVQLPASHLEMVAMEIPDVRNPERLLPLVQCVELMMASIPATSVRKISSAVDTFKAVVDWWGASMSMVTGVLVCAFVVLRCAPPVDMEIPPCLNKPVLPPTAAGDIDSLRRAARLGVGGMAPLLPALMDGRVAALLRSIGARIKHLRTNKRALLYSEVVAFWEQCKTAGTPIAIRDGFALVLAFSFAMRVSELLFILGRDIKVVTLSPTEWAVQIAFRKVKTRQTLLGTHQPFIVTCAGPLLLEAFTLFNEKVGFRDDLNACHAMRASTEKPLTRDWFSHVVKAAAPSATPHSCRVGAATELWAAGVSLKDIMAVGRWTSSTAILYVIGNLDDTVQASRRLGQAGLRYTADGIRRQMGSSQSLPTAARPAADADLWLKSLRSVTEE